MAERTRVNAVIYEPLPDDPSTGRIRWATQAPLEALEQETRFSWIVTEDFSPEYDATHCVQDYRLVQTHRFETVEIDGVETRVLVPIDA